MVNQKSGNAANWVLGRVLVGMVALTLLGGVGMAQAQMKTEANVSVTFGRATLETAQGATAKTSESRFLAVERVELMISGGSADFTTRIRLLTEDRYDRFAAFPGAGGPGMVMDTQFLGHEITWKASKDVNVTLSGSSLGIASLDAKSGMTLFHGVIAPNTASYDDEGYGNQALGRGYGLGNVEYAMDKNTVLGLAVFTDCISGICDAIGAPNVERKTNVLHGRMKMDNMDFSAGYITGSGIARGFRDVTYKATGFQLGGFMKSKDFSAGLDYISNTAKNPVQNAANADQKTSAFSAGLDMNNIRAVYYSGKVNNVGGVKDATISSSSIVAGYGIPVGKTGTVGGEYRTESIAVKGQAKTTDTSIAFGMKNTF